MPCEEWCQVTLFLVMDKDRFDPGMDSFRTLQRDEDLKNRGWTVK